MKLVSILIPARSSGRFGWTLDSFAFALHHDLVLFSTGVMHDGVVG
jgi:hypothetical protein